MEGEKSATESMKPQLATLEAETKATSSEQKVTSQEPQPKQVVVEQTMARFEPQPKQTTVEQTMPQPEPQSSKVEDVSEEKQVGTVVETGKVDETAQQAEVQTVSKEAPEQSGSAPAEETLTPEQAAKRQAYRAHIENLRRLFAQTKVNAKRGGAYLAERGKTLEKPEAMKGLPKLDLKGVISGKVEDNICCNICGRRYHKDKVLAHKALAHG